ncbi:hypothetical protein ICM05_09785 [Leucobacter sp. cx-42]|uniref:hypothetical protein n=1 Tax=unclassified Leucobacter TaxID=2621730 RepID=UPI00165D6EE7|nr:MULTISPECIES: hypothetical protein [unclassified Leucobacter]MBC9954928.1 hypothetical protein [Leucobacter sp. cx-42]
METTERAVTRLTSTHTEHTDAGPVEWPPLIEWLNTSITEVVKRGGAGSGGTGLPLDFEALRLLERIKRETAWMREALYMQRSTVALTASIRETWTRANELRRSGDVPDDQWERITEGIEDWVASIVAEQDQRANLMELTVPCPACGTRWVLEEQDGAEKRRSAVRIEYAEGRAPVASCHAAECEKLWVGWEQLALLGITLNANQDREVLAACGINIPGMNLT